MQIIGQRTPRPCRFCGSASRPTDIAPKGPPWIHAAYRVCSGCEARSATVRTIGSRLAALLAVRAWNLNHHRYVP